ncbi:MAG: cation diffusion facilitator family transporter [Zetaproteobacteria bacterium]|nr:cation diffusion facilitator family transporter [Zetaproteobacteria bacterium]
MSHGSSKTVITAIAGNFIVTIAKFIGFSLSGSSALLAEAVHSLADTSNQALLYLGLRRSLRQADTDHHFGYGQEQYFWNLVSAVTIFFIGCVYTVMHAVDQVQHGHDPQLSLVAFAILGVAFLVEGYSFFVALMEFTRQRKEAGKTFKAYFVETRDPTTLAVLIEDSVAMLGLVLALVGMGMSMWLGSGIFDGIAAICIGLLMGFLAVFLAMVNRKYLLNRSDDHLTEIATRVWANDKRVQGVHRLNSIVLSPTESVLMVELELREEAMFADMSAQEVERAVLFMRKLNSARQDLEDNVMREAPSAKHIFVEFTLPKHVE